MHSNRIGLLSSLFVRQHSFQFFQKTTKNSLKNEKEFSLFFDSDSKIPLHLRQLFLLHGVTRRQLQWQLLKSISMRKKKRGKNCYFEFRPVSRFCDDGKGWNATTDGNEIIQNSVMWASKKSIQNIKGMAEQKAVVFDKIKQIVEWESIFVAKNSFVCIFECFFVIYWNKK